ncbi:MAG TPA: regulatory protein RecX [Clostridia bacterium]|nr:regulatory protein RecX [Clostridia bacterium]
MIITNIEKQKKNKEKYNVYIDGEYAFSCSLEDLSYLGIEEGKEISSKQYNYYVNYISIREATNYTFNLLSRKMLTEKELLIKLKQRGVSEEAAKNVLEKMKNYNYINDKLYAKLFVEQKMTQLYSRQRIYYELLKKGIDKEIIHETIENLYPEDKEVEIIKKLIDKKLNVLPQKLKKYLYNSGFQIENINTVLHAED